MTEREFINYYTGRESDSAEEAVEFAQLREQICLRKRDRELAREFLDAMESGDFRPIPCDIELERFPRA